MEKPVSKSRFGMGNYVMLLVVTLSLVACGGGGGDDTESNGDDFDFDEDFGSLDFDNDGVDDNIDLDADGDGLNDGQDVFVDLNSDGLDDFTGNDLGQAYANDALFADRFDSVTQFDLCGSVAGSDAFSVDNEWNNNCTVARSNGASGIFADSLYAVGVQRIVFCAGFGGTAGQDYNDFADGEYGPASEDALREFQASSPGALADDGVVGMNTWAKLQDVLLDTSRVQVNRDNSVGSARDAFSFISGRCAGITLFYQNISVGGGFDTLGGWSLAQNQPNQNEAIAFSVEPPFSGRLD